MKRISSLFGLKKAGSAHLCLRRLYLPSLCLLLCILISACGRSADGASQAENAGQTEDAGQAESPTDAGDGDGAPVASQFTEQEAQEMVAEAEIRESEQMADKVERLLNKYGIQDMVEVDFNGQYVSMTLNGAILFASGACRKINALSNSFTDISLSAPSKIPFLD